MADVWVLNNEIDMFSKELMYLNEAETCDLSGFQKDLIQVDAAGIENESTGGHESCSEQYLLEFCSSGKSLPDQLWMGAAKHSPTLAELNGTEQDEILSLFDSSFCPNYKRQKTQKHVNSVFSNISDHDSKSVVENVSCSVESQPLEAKGTDSIARFNQTQNLTFVAVPTRIPITSADVVYVDLANGQSVGNGQRTSSFLSSSLGKLDSGVTVVTSPAKLLKSARGSFFDQSVSQVKVTAEPLLKKRKVADSGQCSLEASDSCSSAINYYSSDSDIENIADSHSDEESAAFQPTENTSNSQTKGCFGFDSQKQYFWLYNIQAKGPKSCSNAVGQTTSNADISDPHVLASFEDPAQADMSYRGRHCRSGDVEANPRRLLQIGAEIDRLSKVVSRPSGLLTPREKNKYASRICRLKRKAQFEANKIKLQGLDSEHAELMCVLDAIKSSIVKRVKTLRLNASATKTSETQQPSLCRKLEHLISTNLTDMIAEHTDEFVSCQLQKLKSKRLNETDCK